MNIRPETPQDYADIAAINARAFKRAAEPSVVMLLRQRVEFDVELSLVAEIDGEIAGHVMFSPYTVRILDADVQAVSLAPIAVNPSQQARGIGAALIEEGHRIARQKGYTLSFLLGHPTYYPRFGYQVGAYGSSAIKVEGRQLPPCTLEVRSPMQDDIPAIIDLWHHEEDHVDFSVFPGNALLDWLSPNPSIESHVYLRGEDIVGYTRSSVFLAQDENTAREMASYLARGESEIELGLHPHSASATAFGLPTANPWEVGMAISLAANPFDEYYERVQRGEHPPGRVHWHTAFELA